MGQSKQNSQSDQLWFQKNNYMSKFLSQKDKDIIKNILNKKY